MKKIVCIIIMAFILGIGVSCSKDKNKDLNIISPLGAPALAIAKLESDSKAIDNYELTFDHSSGTDGITAAFTSKSHDVIISPINIGAKMYKANQDYRLASCITFGNLFLVSFKEINVVDMLNMKTYLFGQNTVNDMVVKKVLGVSFPTNTTYMASTNETKEQILLDSTNNIFDSAYLIAEPALEAVRTQLTKKGITIFTLDIQSLYKNQQDNNEFIQAGVFIKDSFYKKHSEVIDQLLVDIEASILFTNNNKEEVCDLAQALELGLPPKAVLKNAIPLCNIRFKKATQIKTSLEEMFKDNLSLIGGTNPDEEFYLY